MQRVIVTGAGGFIGSRICNQLSASGIKVGAVGRFDTMTGRAEFWRGAEIAGLSLPDPAFNRFVSKFKPDALIHCAALASVPFSVEHPHADFCGSADVCAFTLETLRQHAPECRFYLISSAAVYGNPPELPISEDAPCKPVSPYGYHKRICELLQEEYSSLHGIKGATFRIFSAYGPGLRKQVVYDLFQKFMQKTDEPITIFGTGDESRDFIHVSDIARALCIAVEKHAEGIYNLSSGVETRIRELAEIIRNICQSKRKIKTSQQPRKGDPLCWRADINRIKKLGFSCETELKEGLNDLYSWLKAQPAK